MSRVQPIAALGEAHALGPSTIPRRIALATAAAILAFLAVRAFNPYTGVPPHIDSGVYLGAAEHLLHGKALYREVWDHKPPVVHAINAIALSFGDHTVNAVRTLERWAAVLAALAVLVAAFLAFDSAAVSALASVLFLVHFYHPNVMRGNQPEEYGSILTLVGVLLALASLTVARRRLYTLILTAGSGLLFGLACLTKETFAFGALPWFLFLMWRGWEDRRATVRTSCWFLIGLSLPLLAFAVYLVWNGAFADWVAVVRFNLSYVHFDARNEPNPALPGLLWVGFRRATELLFSVSWLTVAAAVLGAASAASSSFRRATGGTPLVVLAFFMFNLAAVSLARRYGYYYLQLVSSYVLLAACGVAFLVFLTRTRRALRSAVPVVFTIALIAIDHAEAMRFARAVMQSRAWFHGDRDTVTFVRENTGPSDPIWNLARDGSAIYAHAGRLSPTRFFYLAANLFRDLPKPENARREIREALAAHPPRVIVFDGDEAWLAKVGLSDWFRENYVPTPVPRVFLRKPDSAVTPPHR